MNKKIPYGRQNITKRDIEEVAKVLGSDYLTQGPKIGEFETSFADYIGCKYAVAVSNGTAALHLSAIALNVGPGDKIITTPITFAASANCILYCGGEVDFIDIDPKTYLIDLDKIEKTLASSPKVSYKGIIAVDFAGLSVDTEKLRKIANQYGLWIIEDACHAPGGYYIDSNDSKTYCGDGQYADLSIFSFHPVKHIATGEGGMITTNNEDLYKKLISLRTHGITKTPELLKNNHGGWYYEMQELGFNYRLTDIQAALGISQLKRAEDGLIRRRQIASIYDQAFEGKSFIKGQSGLVKGHAYHLYIIEVENRKGLYEFLQSNNIFVQVHYIPIHLFPYYQQLGWNNGDMPHSENYYWHCLSLPMFPSLTNDDQKFVIRMIEEFYQKS